MVGLVIDHARHLPVVGLRQFNICKYHGVDVLKNELAHSAPAQSVGNYWEMELLPWKIGEGHTTLIIQQFCSARKYIPYLQRPAIGLGKLHQLLRPFQQPVVWKLPGADIALRVISPLSGPDNRL